MTREHALRLLRLSAGLVALLGFVSGAAADWKPAKPMRILVPFPPGGASDTAVRTIAQEVSKNVGQAIVIENRPGASGKILYEYFKSVPGDGYTLAYVSSTVAVLTAVSTKLDFDVIKDFKPVTVMAEFTGLLAASTAVPAKDFREFAAYAKSRPGALFYASYGVKGQGHLNMEQLKQAAGLDLVHVPFKGEAPTVTALITNEVQIGPVILSPKQYVDAGKLKVLAAMGKTRHPEFPEVQTLIEQGFEYSSKTWMGLAGAPGTSNDIIEYWNKAFVTTIQKPEMVQRLKELGFTARGTKPEEVTSELQNDIDTYRKVVARANIDLD